MFTGIVEELGEVVSVQIAPDGADAVIAVRGPAVTADARTGDSIAVSGVCLTVIRVDGGTFTADVMCETLSRTTAASWRPGSRVNLERSVTPTTRMGGHLVQGHVDGVGTVTARTTHPGYDELTIRVPVELSKVRTSLAPTPRALPTSPWGSFRRPGRLPLWAASPWVTV